MFNLPHQTAAGSDGTPWYEQEGWLREPVFEDVPYEQSGWKPLIEQLKQVNLAKANLLISLYEEIRLAYQRYRQIREQEEARFVQERVDAEKRNDALREQIRAVEQQMEPIRQRWQPELDALREELYRAWREAYEQAAQAGINLRGDPLSEEAFTANSSAQSPMSSASPAEAGATLPPAPQTEPNLPVLSIAQPPEPPPLTPSEVIHEQNLPHYQGRLVPPTLWWALIVVAGAGLGLMLALIVGLVVPGEPIREPILTALASLAGIALAYLWTRVLWGATAVVAELYHLFGWSASKSRLAAWSVGIGLVLTLLALAPWWLLLVNLARSASASGGWVSLVMLVTMLLMLPLLACAMLEGFLEGRAKPIGHWVAARLTQDERERAQRARATPGEQEREPHERETPATAILQEGSNGNPATPADQRAWVAIRRYQALYRQYHHLRGEMEQALAPYREQIELLKAELRPVYPALPPHSRNRIALAYRQWHERYHTFMQTLADAVRECHNGQELAAIVQAMMSDRTP